MNRNTAILLIITALTVILAHSFVPHTHHEDHICLTALTGCHGCGDADQSRHNKEEDGCGEGECVLLSALVYAPQDNKPFSFCSCCKENDSHITRLQTSLSYTGLTVYRPGLCLPFRQKPYITPVAGSGSEPFSATRAPPLS